jgi:hypothetical protein
MDESVDGVASEMQSASFPVRSCARLDNPLARPFVPGAASAGSGGRSAVSLSRAGRTAGLSTMTVRGGIDR